jgi:hypothetical protein
VFCFETENAPVPGSEDFSETFPEYGRLTADVSAFSLTTFSCYLFFH